MARSIFPSQTVQNAPWPDHFWKVRCRKSARRCGAKHMFKSKCTKHSRFGAVLEVELRCRKSAHCCGAKHVSKPKMLKTDEFRCRKGAHRCGVKHISKSKVLKNDALRAPLEVQMSKKCTPLWREAHFEVKSVKK